MPRYMASQLITGNWENLIFVNYVVDLEKLLPFVPAGTELNLYRGTCYVTLAGFMFSNIRIKGIPIPFHQRVPEVNLRFYVIPKGGTQADRGVVFLRELISKPIMALAANQFYHEHYRVRPVKASERTTSRLRIRYRWSEQSKLQAVVQTNGYLPENESLEEFLMMQYFGYSRIGNTKTIRYAVTHPKWKLYPLKRYVLRAQFGRDFRQEFAFLKKQEPVSVFVAKGSPIAIHAPTLLRGSPG